MLKHNTFSKSQRLKSRKKLQQLFTEGKSVRTPNIRIVYLLEKAPTGEVKCGVGLTTKYFKKAVDRNRIKRLLREAYRLQQHPLNRYTAENNQSLSLFILYSGKELPAYHIIYENVEIALQKLTGILHAAGA